MKKVIVQRWIRLETGNGSKPIDEKYSLHLTEPDRIGFIQRYHEEVHSSQQTVETYWSPLGDPYDTIVSEETLSSLKARAYGAWCTGRLPVEASKLLSHQKT